MFSPMQPSIGRDRPFRVIIAGGRNFTDYSFMCAILDGFERQHDITEVVCGEARGADSLGRRWAEEGDIPIASFPADWDRYGKAAGFKRNQRMADYADALIAFPGGTGTADMVRRMKELGKPYIQIAGEW